MRILSTILTIQLVLAVLMPSVNASMLPPVHPQGSTPQRVHSPPRVSGVTADYIMIEKSKRRLTLMAKGQILKVYSISLGRSPVGKKIMVGDERTPEGIYKIDYRLDNSRYHRALHISYPSVNDRKYAKKLDVSPGGDIMIHGIGKAKEKMGGLYLLFDWTNGCIAVTDQEIEEIWRVTPVGTVVRSEEHTSELQSH